MIPTEVEQILNGSHGDPFHILGPHAMAGGGWEVHAFLPGAEAAFVKMSEGRTPMQRVHKDGFFTAPMEGGRKPYTLAVEYPDASIEIEDPYRFPPVLSSFDLHLHVQGTLEQAWQTLGAHFVECEGVKGVRFAVWAPNAQSVSVTGDFDSWNANMHPMRLRDGGIWELFLPSIARGAHYKYCVTWKGGHRQLKTDPYGFYSEVPPATASRVWGVPEYEWNDQKWMDARAKADCLKQPVSIYEVHLGSWLEGEQGRSLSYRDLAERLVSYVKDMGFTHIELMPILEHPFSGSWGYQVTGFFAPTARFGPPEDLMYFIDRCHEANIGVILDWVPGHFPKDAHGLARFDGTALYEHADSRQGEHLDWGTLIFNYGRNEVRGFLLASALFWLRHFHIDGLRVDAVASMLYLDYSRQHGDWVPNRYGGRENLEAIDFLRRFNELAHQVPGAFTVAEESTAYPGVCRPVYLGGLGFTMKWNMGWMHDMFRYFKFDPIHRKYHHHDVTFSLLYAFTENFMLPVSHDEVVHMKGSLIGKMPGDEWRKFANVRAFLAYMWTHPGKKLLFMGQEIGQYEEWSEKRGIRWELLAFAYHRNLQAMVRELNRLYQSEPALYEVDFHWAGFEWIDLSDVDQSVISFLRFSAERREFLVVVCNLTPQPRHGYRIGVPRAGYYRELLNTDAAPFGGSNVGNGGMVHASWDRWQGRDASVVLSLPPLAVLVLKPVGEPEPDPARLSELPEADSE